MRIQERWFLIATAASCLLGAVFCATDADTWTTTPGDYDIPGVEPLPTMIIPGSDDIPTVVETKTEFPAKEVDSKLSIDGKKKTVIDFKQKNELKYQKPKDEPTVEETTTWEPTTESTTTEDFETTTEEENIIADQRMVMMDQKLESNLTNGIPLLVQGVPNLVPTLDLVQATSATEIPLMMNITTTESAKKEEDMTTTVETTSSRARALNISAPEPTNSLNTNFTDLSDVSMDDDDKEVEGGEYIAPQNETTMNISSTLLPTTSVCTEGNKTYTLGEKIIRGCDEKCVCGEDGKIMDCKPLCLNPYIRAGRGVQDPLCEEKLIAEEPCCAIMVCAEDSATEPDETCVFGNKTLTRGQKVEDGCSKTCVCEAGGSLKCQPRCPPNDTTSGVTQHDRCVALTDPSDTCCTITLCDVTLGDHELKPENPAEISVNLTDVKVLNSTAIKLKLSTKTPENVTIELSENNHVWRQVRPDKEGIISGLEPAHSYFLRVNENGRLGHALHVSLLAEVIKTNITEKVDKNTCSHRGKTYKIGAEWYDECLSICTCGKDGKADCSTIECPTDFGLDVLDPHCLDWETVPPDFEPKAPNCCPQEVRCRDNGSCTFNDKFYDNWSQLPINVTGCEKRCYCEMGNLTCSDVCPPVADQLSSLNCPPHQATLTHLPGDDCCMHWVCKSPILPGVNTTMNLGPLGAISDDSKKPYNKSEMSRPVQEPERGTYPWEGPKKSQSLKPPPDQAIFHLPMDPGHPTLPYNGPYNPDYKPTPPSVEQIFHLPPNSEKTAPPLKEKTKSKSDSKKPIDPLKTHKETVEQFPGPFAPDKFPFENKLPSKEGHVEDPQFIPLGTHDQSSGPAFDFSPANGENIPPDHFDSQFKNPAAGPPYRGPGKSEANDPNLVIPSPPKKKDSSANDGKVKPQGAGPKPTQGQKNPNIHNEQYHPFIHPISQHPGLIELEHGPPPGHPGLYDLHKKIVGQKNPPVNQIPPFFGNNDPLPPKKETKPHIFTQQNENGETTIHIHTPDIPSSPEQIEELLLTHIGPHDPNHPFQHYHGQEGISHNVAGLTPPSLSHPDDHSQSGLTHLNHPFAAHTPNQSGLEHGIHQGFPIAGPPPGFTGQGGQQEVTVQALEALDEHTVRLVFTVPVIFVGLQGRVELRYTGDKMNFDPATWKSQEFAPPDDLIATQQLEFELGDLKPSTEYKVQIIVKLHKLNNTPMSKIYSVRTLDKVPEVSTLPPQIPIDAELRIQDINSTWVNVHWKTLSDYELQFIDGIQLRYKEPDSKIYITTPMIHRKVTNYEIENLKSSTKYEVQIIFIPFPGQTTELISDKKIHFTTSEEPDPYFFSVRAKVDERKSQEVDISWSGVPYPEDKYVNIYRAIYQSDTGKEDTSVFKIAKRDSPAKTTIRDLKPGTRYRLWIEVYLTNGKIKKSNVLDFSTKPGGPAYSGKLASIPLHDGDYYGPLVIVAIVASLAILSTLILLMMLMKRRTSSKADISPRKTTSAYDNPSYKTCEDAVTISNGRNKPAEHEMATINTSANGKETA